MPTADLVVLPGRVVAGLKGTREAMSYIFPFPLNLLFVYLHV